MADFADRLLGFARRNAHDDLIAYLTAEGPRALNVQTTDVCDLRCRHCSFGRGIAVRAVAPPLGADDWSRVIEDARDLGVRLVAVASREPLLPSVMPLTRHVLSRAQNLDLEATLVTNGTHLSEFAERYDLKPLACLDVSLEGDEAANDRIRGAGSFRRAIYGLEAARRHSIARQFFISMTATRDNCEVLARDIVTLSERLNLRNFCVNAVFAGVHVEPGLWLQAGDAAPLLERLGRIAPRLDNLILDVYSNSFPDFADLIERGDLPAPSEVFEDEVGTVVGQAGDNFYVRYQFPQFMLPILVVTPDGFVVSLEGEQFTDYDKIAWGSVRERRLSRIWPDVRLDPPDRRTLEVCQGRPCYPICWGTNARCTHLQRDRECVSK